MGAQRRYSGTVPPAIIGSCNRTCGMDASEPIKALSPSWPLVSSLPLKNGLLLRLTPVSWDGAATGSAALAYRCKQSFIVSDSAHTKTRAPTDLSCLV